MTLLKIKIPSSYIRTRGISRVTTLIRKLLAQLTSMSVRQHSSAFNVHQSVTAYLLNQSVQCAAQGCNSLQQGMSYMRSMYDPDQRNHWIPYCPLNPTSGVLVLRFPRTSHQPVTFCAFHKAVLIPVFAFRCFNCIYYRRVRSLLSTANRCFLSRICLMNALLQAFILK